MGILFSSRSRPLAHKHYETFVDALPSQKGRYIAITGTSSGIGMEAARAVVHVGGHVLCLNRPSQHASASLCILQDECVAGGSATGVDCDLQDFGSVHSAANVIREHVGDTGLRALINNAGCMGLPERATRDGFDVQMQTNHLGHFLLTSLLMPALEQAASTSGDARVVNQTGAARNMDGKQVQGVYPLEAKYMKRLPDSEQADEVPPSAALTSAHAESPKQAILGGNSEAAAFKRYQQSKLANVVFTLALQAKLQERGSRMKAVVAHPGICETAFEAKSTGVGGKPGLAGRIVMSVLKHFSQSCGDGSMPILAAAMHPDVDSGDFYGPSVVGFFGKMLGEPMTGLPQKVLWQTVREREAAALDPQCQQLLWRCSEEAIGKPFFP